MRKLSLLLAFLMTAGTFIIAGCQESKQTADDFEDAAREAADTAEDVGREAADAAGDAAREAADAIEDAAGEIESEM